MNYFCFTFELLTRCWKTKSYVFAFQILIEVKKQKISLRVTNSVGALLFSHIRVTNVKLINEKHSINITVWMFVNPLKSILLLRFLRTSYNSKSRGCPDILKIAVAWMWSLTHGNLSNLCLRTTSLLVPDTIKFKNFETWLPATYNNGRVVKY